KEKKRCEDEGLVYDDAIRSVVEPGQVEDEVRKAQVKERNRGNEAEERYEPGEVPRKMRSLKEHEDRRDNQTVSQIASIVAASIPNHPKRKTTKNSSRKNEISPG